MSNEKETWTIMPHAQPMGQPVKVELEELAQFVGRNKANEILAGEPDEVN